jgi:hypothetical protein
MTKNHALRDDGSEIGDAEEQSGKRTTPAEVRRAGDTLGKAVFV